MENLRITLLFIASVWVPILMMVLIVSSIGEHRVTNLFRKFLRLFGFKFHVWKSGSHNGKLYDRICVHCDIEVHDMLWAWDWSPAGSEVTSWTHPHKEHKCWFTQTEKEWENAQEKN